jgi:hypothetical protein
LSEKRSDPSMPEITNTNSERYASTVNTNSYTQQASDSQAIQE